MRLWCDNARGNVGILYTNILTRYNSPNKNNDVLKLKRKMVIFQLAMLTQVEIRNISFTRRLFKIDRNKLMLICMFQVKLKISNSCRCF